MRDQQIVALIAAQVMNKENLQDVSEEVFTERVNFAVVTGMSILLKAYENDVDYTCDLGSLEEQEIRERQELIDNN